MPKINYNNRNREFARSLRKNMTRQEKHLWYDFLKTYPVQFRRQKQFGDYIVDFYCGAATLVIELDGGQHYSDEGLEKDAERSRYLESIGLKVLRYTNADIDRRFKSVCEQIDLTVKERTSSAPSGHLPLKGKADLIRPFGAPSPEGEGRPHPSASPLEKIL